jgi:hypothetical protein
MSFGQHLRGLREGAGLSRAELAQISWVMSRGREGVSLLWYAPPLSGRPSGSILAPAAGG